jgi:beta-lactamase class A
MRPLRLAAILLALTGAHLLCTKLLQMRADGATGLEPSPGEAASANDAERPAANEARGELAASARLDVPARSGADPGGADPGDATAGEADADPAHAVWKERLARLLAGAARTPNHPSMTSGEIGVYVRQLRTGQEFGLRADEPWYLASGVKVPVALAVLRKRELGLLDLDAQLRLEPGDRVDGTGSTNGHPVGTLLRVDYLLEQMLVYSDNTATDMLIRAVGLDEVNRVARELSGRDFAITSLAEVRRKIYGGFHPRGGSLGFADWVALRGVGELQRAASVGRLLGVPLQELSSATLADAYARYYREGVNSAPLAAYGELLAQIAAGKALGAEATGYLLGVMSRVRTGTKRLPAGLPAGLAFAHKTGTQYERVCDFGLTLSSAEETLASPRADVVIAACARGFRSHAAAERALRDVGVALRRSGVFDATPSEFRPPSAPSEFRSPQELRREDEPTQVAQGVGVSGRDASRRDAAGPGVSVAAAPGEAGRWATRDGDVGAPVRSLHLRRAGDPL